VVNLSFGGERDRLVLWLVDRAIDAGLVVVAAAGNGGPDAAPVWPAAHAPVIAVGAIDARGAPWARSARGSHVLLAAPGVEVLSLSGPRGYGLFTGTSIAAAHVSGVAALLLQRAPGLSPAEVRRRLLGSAGAPRVPGASEPGARVVDARLALD
jgi:subtilisin family serine protease